MATDIGLSIILKNGTTSKKFTISDLGGADDFFFLINDGRSHNLELNLSEETKEKIEDYRIEEDEQDHQNHIIYVKSSKLNKLAESIRTDIIRKVNRKELIIDSENHMYIHNIMQIIGGICSICLYVSENDSGEVALVSNHY